jgi:ABC-2 type transport system permease protein
MSAIVLPAAAPAPTSAAARVLRVLLKETRYEFTRLMRTRSFSLSVIGLPVMFYLIFGTLSRHGEGARYVIAGYACMGMVSACLFGIGLTLALERAQGWLEVKRASPMPPLAYLGAKMASCAGFGLLIVAVLIALGAALDGIHVSAGEAAGLAAVILAGSIPFAAMGLLIALLVPANAGPGLINLIYLPMAFVSGFWMPVSVLPPWLQAVAHGLPTYHLAQLALATFGFAPVGRMPLHAAVLAGFTVLMLGAAWITFVRSEARA